MKIFSSKAKTCCPWFHSSTSKNNSELIVINRKKPFLWTFQLQKQNQTALIEYKLPFIWYNYWLQEHMHSSVTTFILKRFIYKAQKPGLMLGRWTKPRMRMGADKKQSIVSQNNEIWKWTTNGNRKSDALKAYHWCMTRVHSHNTVKNISERRKSMILCSDFRLCW